MANKPKWGLGKLWEVRRFASTLLISIVLFITHPPDVVTIGIGAFSFEYQKQKEEPNGPFPELHLLI